MAKKAAVICWLTGTEKPALPRLKPGTHGVELVRVADLDAAREALTGASEAVLLLTDLNAESEAGVQALRNERQSGGLPLFAALASERIDLQLQDRANALDVEIIPLPFPERRFWSYLREAAVRYSRKGFHPQPSRRRYFRMPLKVTAFTPVEVQTVDIGPAGIQFLSSHPYQTGDTGRLDIPSLSEIIGGMLEFEVVATSKAKNETYPYRVSAKFTNLDFETMRKLGETLLSLEP